MKIITSSDWHLGNLFHGIDRLSEHKNFLAWLQQQIEEQKPDALLIAGDIFDNGNPSAAAQTVYYQFLANVTRDNPGLQVVITAGNHDAAQRLEAPRPMLACQNVELRGTVHRNWDVDSDNPNGHWVIDYDDLMIPIHDAEGNEVVVLAVPFLRNDVASGDNYSQGVNRFLHELTDRARERFPNRKLVMMAHLYAKGADIALKDASEKIVIGGQEEVVFEQWNNHPDYLTCGHIHKRQHIWNCDWARYTGSILPMSIAEKDYTHGVDLITLDNHSKPIVQQLVYEPQHKLRILPEKEEEQEPKKLKKVIEAVLPEQNQDGPDEHADYVFLNVRMEKVDNDVIKELEDLVASRNAILCKINRIHTQVSVTSLTGDTKMSSINDILTRNPMDTLKEAFTIKHKTEMTEEQIALLDELLKENMNETQA